MTVAEAARALGVSRGTVYRRIRKGLIPATKVGRRWVVGGLNLPEPEAPPVPEKTYTMEEAILRANNLILEVDARTPRVEPEPGHAAPGPMGDAFFSAKQPAFWLGFCASVGVDTSDDLYREDELQRVAEAVVERDRGYSQAVKDDYRMTRETEGPPVTRIILIDLFAAVKDQYRAKHGGDPLRVLSKRRDLGPFAVRFCAEAGIDIYTERWHGRPSGDTFILPDYRDELYDHIRDDLNRDHAWVQQSLDQECTGLWTNCNRLCNRVGQPQEPPYVAPATFELRDRLKARQRDLYAAWARKRAEWEASREEREEQQRQERARKAAEQKAKVARWRAQQEARRQEFQAQQEKQKRDDTLVALIETLRSQLEYHLMGESDETKLALLRKAARMGDQWAAAAGVVAGENGWTL